MWIYRIDNLGREYIESVISCTIYVRFRTNTQNVKKLSVKRMQSLSKLLLHSRLSVVTILQWINLGGKNTARFVPRLNLYPGICKGWCLPIDQAWPPHFQSTRPIPSPNLTFWKMENNNIRIHVIAMQLIYPSEKYLMIKILHLRRCDG